MFLPGAQYVAYSIVIFASLLTCICGGAIGVVLGSGLASKLLPKTKTYTKMVQGYEAPKGGYPFWVHKIVWINRIRHQLFLNQILDSCV